MVTRTSQPLDLQGRGGYGEVQQVGAGTVQQRGDLTLGDGGDSYREQLVQSLLGQGVEVANQGVRTAEVDAYLAGHAKAGQVASENELQSSWLTADWATAGYRDAMGRLKLADAEAQFGVDLAELRQKGPEEMNAYLAKRRASLTPMLEGMSREQRATAFGALLISDRAAIAKHTIAHVDWQREIEQQTWQANWSAAKAGQVAAMQLGDPKVLQLYNEHAVNVLAGIMMSKRLTPEQREQMIVDATEDALSADNSSFYSYLRNVNLPGPDTPGGEPGKGSSLLSRMSIASQEMLSKAHVAVMDRTRVRRNQQVLNDTVKYEGAFKAGTFKGTRAEVEAFATENLRSELWGREKYESFMRMYDDMDREQGTATNIMDAFLGGRTNAHHLLGADGGQALEITKKELDKAGVPQAQQMVMLFEAGTRNSPEGFKGAGAIASKAVSSWNVVQGRVPEEHVQATKTMLSMLDSFPDESGKYAQLFYSGMTEEARDRVMAVREMVKDGKSQEQAIALRMEQEGRLAAMPTQVRAGIAEEQGRAASKFLHERMQARGFLDKVAGFNPFATQTQALNTVLPTTSVPQAVRDVSMQKSYDAVAVAFKRQFLKNPMVSAEKAEEAALADVTARAVPTPSGPLIVPEGRSPQQFFGVTASAETIGRALTATLTPTTKDGVFTYTAANGQIIWQEHNSEGVPVLGSKGILNPQDIKPAMERELNAKREKHARVTWRGVDVTKDGHTITVKGENTASVSFDVALQFRLNVVENEGIRNKMYKDGKGKDTAGVGIAHPAYMPKPGPDGTISREDIERSFRAASNDALREGEKARRSVPNLRGDSATLLLSEMTYQTGPLLSTKRKPEYAPFLEALARGTPEAAIAAFRNTGVYAASGPERRVHYEKLINQTLKERK